MATCYDTITSKSKVFFSEIVISTLSQLRIKAIFKAQESHGEKAKSTVIHAVLKKVTIFWPVH